MNFRLRHLRKASKMTQLELAQAISVDIKTIGNWERGETVPDAEQVWNCAEALGCTPNDILGWHQSHASETTLEDAFEKELIGCYRESTTARKGRILDTARDAAAISKESAERAAHEPAAKEAV